MLVPSRCQMGLSALTEMRLTYNRASERVEVLLQGKVRQERMPGTGGSVPTLLLQAGWARWRSDAQGRRGCPSAGRAG